MRPLWVEVRAAVILALALATVVVGTLGYMSEGGGSEDPLDALYKSIQLFGLGASDVPPDAPIGLRIARFVAPLLVGYAAIRGLLLLGRQQFRLLGFRLFRRDHVVLVGLGSVGFHLATALDAAGARIIVIERNPANVHLESCRERGIGLLLSDGADPSVLDAARVGRARYLIVTSGDDGTNIDVIAATRSIVPGVRRHPLVTFAQITDRGLWRALEAKTLAEEPESAFRLELFNVYETGIRLMLADHPPFRTPDPDPSILISADAASSESLVVNTARLWRGIRHSSEERARITLMDSEATALRDGILERHPRLDSICQIEAWDTTGPSAIRADARVLGASAIYVARDDEARSVSDALLLASAADSTDEVVLVVRDARQGAAAIVSDPTGAGGPVKVFGILNHALHADLLTSGLNETMARTMHENYVRSARELGETTTTNESLVPWAELPDALRESNRRYAAGIGAKLRAIECVLVPASLVTLEDSLSEFREAEVEELAELEHQRWVEDLRRDGYAIGHTKDPVRREHPLLVPWSELSEEDREKDRVAVRDLPRMLAAAGFEIHRREAHADNPRSPV